MPSPLLAVIPCSHLSLPLYRPSSLLCALHQDSRALGRGCSARRRGSHVCAASEVAQAAAEATGRKGGEEAVAEAPSAVVSWDDDARRREAAEMQLTQVGAVISESLAYLHGPRHAHTTCHRPSCKARWQAVL